MDPSPHRGSSSRPHPAHHDGNNNNSNIITNDQSHHRVRFAEGEPQASYTVHQPTPRRGAAAASAGRPAVYWDERGPNRDIDRDGDANLAGYTFYREGTPTPPDYGDAPEKRLGHHDHGGGFAGPVAENSTIGGGTIGSDRDFNPGHRHQADMGNWSEADSIQMSVSTKRRVFWILVIAGIVVLIGVGVGVGLGVGLSKGKGSAASPIDSSSSSLPISAIEPNPTVTDPPTASAAGTESATHTTAVDPRPTYNSDCPALNNTIYHVPGSTKSFLRLCGLDFSGTDALDLAEAYTESMADCINSCASFDQCTACSWGYLKGDQGTKHRCYMKKNLKQSHVAASDWCFAVLQK